MHESGTDGDSGIVFEDDAELLLSCYFYRRSKPNVKFSEIAKKMLKALKSDCAVNIIAGDLIIFLKRHMTRCMFSWLLIQDNLVVTTLHYCT